MRVFVCFQRLREADYALNSILFGQFEFVDLLFICDSQITLYLTRPHDVYTRVTLTKERMALTNNYWNGQRAYLELSMSDDEGVKLLRTCDTFASVGLPYNFLDFMLSAVPLRSPDELPLFEARTLSDVQSVILMLRECLNSEHRVLVVLKDLNSRQTLVSHLFETLRPVMTQLIWEDVQKLLPVSE